MQLAARAQAVGIDRRDVLRPGDHAGRLLTEAVIAGAEAVQEARLAAAADRAADRVVLGVADLFVTLGLLTRKDA